MSGFAVLSNVGMNVEDVIAWVDDESIRISIFFIVTVVGR